MPSTLLPDPMQLWRDALARIEAGIRALANGRGKSHRVLRSLAALAAASRSLHDLRDKLTTEGWHGLNLPTRADVAALEKLLQRIDAKLDRLLPPATAETPRRPSARRARELSGAAEPGARRAPRRRAQNGKPT